MQQIKKRACIAAERGKHTQLLQEFLSKDGLLQWRTERGVWGVQTLLPPKFRSPSKIVPNSTRFVKTVKNCWI